MVYVYFDRFSSRTAMEKLEKSLKELNVKYKLEFFPPGEAEAGSYSHIFMDFGGIHTGSAERGGNFNLFLHRVGRFIRMIEDNPSTVFVVHSEVVWTFMSKEIPELDSLPNACKVSWHVTTPEVAKIPGMG